RSHLERWHHRGRRALVRCRKPAWYRRSRSHRGDRPEPRDGPGLWKNEVNMNALYYLVDTLTSLYLGVLILRLIMQIVRANFRNPFAEAVLRVTNPLIMPLRRVLPPVGKTDSATVLAIVLFAVFKVALMSLLFGGGLLSLIAMTTIVLRTLVL